MRRICGEMLQNPPNFCVWCKIAHKRRPKCYRLHDRTHQFFTSLPHLAPRTVVFNEVSMWFRAKLAAGCLMLCAQNEVVAQSLFVGRQTDSFFAPRVQVEPKEAVIRGPAVAASEPLYDASHSDLHRVRLLIEEAESRRDGYDAVQHGAKQRPSKLPTQMTIGEIYDWIKATPGQPHAIGRYQFIPATLRRLVGELGVTRAERFSPRLQDKLADRLLEEAGMIEFRAGQITRHAFMNNLAKIWAGLPNSSGRSHYHGYAGNKASMSWARFDREMAEIFPALS